ncbi:MAG TPA: peptidylprolyl isomerase [Pirellulales bacterium]|jgi:parvulin-like peptidyl-prolyl isomerase|nr:peptidylprolyl isomerase [Pirellulales bacterium]
MTAKNKQARQAGCRRWISPWAALLICGYGVAGRAADPPAENTVVAKIDDQPIYRQDVEHVIHAALKGRSVAAEAIPAMQAQALAQLIDRTLIEKFLAREKQTLSEKEVDNTIDSMKQEIKAKGQDWDHYLATTGMNEAYLRRAVAWERNFDRYLSRIVNLEQMQAYFDKHRRDLDGTELHVSHILLRPARMGDAKEMAELIKRAEKIRQQISDGEISFSTAAQRYSNGPSHLTGGDLGYIPRHGRMVEEFSRAAFALKTNEVSQPVVTTFGVHLIRWTDEHPGTKTLADSSVAVKTAIAQEMFESLAATERKNAKIEFTGAMPHYLPGTHDLVIP